MFAIEAKYTKYPKKLIVKKLDQGFSLIETVIALTTLGVCLAYAMPLFLYAKVNNSKSEIRTGALIVSQRVFDSIRSKSFKSMPQSDGANVNAAVAEVPATTVPPITPAIPAIPANPETITDPLITKAMGRQYQTKVTYCEGLTSDAAICGEKYRQFKVEVFHNGTKVYDLEGNFTDFQQST